MTETAPDAPARIAASLPALLLWAFALTPTAFALAPQGPALSHPESTTLFRPEGVPAITFTSVSLARSADSGPGPARIGVTPSGLSVEHASVRDLIRYAYRARANDQIAGGPEWIVTDFYDVKAAISDADKAAINALPPLQRFDAARGMVRSLLQTRFKFQGTVETRSLPVYALVVASQTPRLTEVQITPVAPGTPPPPGAHVPSLSTQPTQVVASAISMHTLADVLTMYDELSGHMVVDETGLTGAYDFVLSGVSQTRTKTAAATSIFSALKDQLGLRLDLRKGTKVEVVAVSHLERGSDSVTGA